MSFAVTTNIVTMLFCFAVLVQSVRMMRSLKTVKDGALTNVVEALDKSTAQARAVLSDMKETLRGDCAANARLVEQARVLRDELEMMIGIADASAERIVTAVQQNNQANKANEAARSARARAPAKPVGKAGTAKAATAPRSARAKTADADKPTDKPATRAKAAPSEKPGKPVKAPAAPRIREAEDRATPRKDGVREKKDALSEEGSALLARAIAEVGRERA